MGRKKKSIEEIRQFFEKEGYELLSTEYVNKNTKLEYICPEGHKHSMSWDNFSHGRRCPECAMENRKSKLKISYDEIKQAFESEGYILLSTEYINNSSKLEYICPKGHKHSTNWDNFKQGRRCPECGIETVKSKLKLSYDEVKQGFELEGYTLLSTKYIKNTSKLKVQCPKGHEYEVSWGHFNEGKRCPVCNSSKGEKRISLFLKGNNINYEVQKSFKECSYKRMLPFDFYLPDHNICIEYDGQQHYNTIDFSGKNQERAEEQFKQTQIKDNIKTQYCLDHNIKLIRIPYWDFKNIENILKQELNLE